MVDNEKEVMVNDNREGVLRAEREPYAFFMESVSIEYEIQRHCNLSKVGDLLDEKGYGIAMRKSKYLWNKFYYSRVFDIRRFCTYSTEVDQRVFVVFHYLVYKL